MITQMKKYNFLVFHKEYDAFLTMLQEAGVVHVTEKAEGLADNPELSAQLALSQQLQQAIKQLEALVPAGSNPLAAEKADAAELLQQLDQLNADKQNVEQLIQATRKEADRMKLWGNFDRKKLDALAEAGYVLQFFTCASHKYQAEWESAYNAVLLSDPKSSTYCFCTVNHERILIEADEQTLNPHSYDQLLADINAQQGLLAAAQAGLEGFAIKKLESFRLALRTCKSAIDWQKVQLSTNRAAEDTLCLLEGFCPIDKVEALDNQLNAAHIYYQEADPNDEDQTPIKLRNNKFTRIFEPLTGMYGWPSYGEFDPTPILAPFYLLFFALCMGDMGYGIILVIYGLLQTKKIVNISMFDGLGPIITALGVATIVVGFLMNTVFGVPVTMLDWHPAKVAGFDFWMVAAVAIGVFHICFAMTVKAICSTVRYGFRQTVSTWGWLLLIVGSISTILLSMAFSLPTNVVKYTIIGIGAVSALGIYLFNTPGRNPLINVGAGLWDTYNMASGLLGDVLSYIRLYALGLAGGMLGKAFNDLAVNMIWAGGEGAIAAVVLKGAGMVLVLLLGHVLNLLMACLGAFVHPLRLTFVEYFKNAGYEGKGVLYQPFGGK